MDTQTQYARIPAIAPHPPRLKGSESRDDIVKAFVGYFQELVFRLATPTPAFDHCDMVSELVCDLLEHIDNEGCDFRTTYAQFRRRTKWKLKKWNSQPRIQVERGIRERDSEYLPNFTRGLERCESCLKLNHIMKTIESRKPITHRVLVDRFLNDLTLAEVGRKFMFTGSRAGQIEKHGIELLREKCLQWGYSESEGDFVS